GFEIIVASNNNAAVENITKELPKVDTLGDEFMGVEYLRPTAELYRRVSQGGKEAHSSEEGRDRIWGCPSAALGNKSNRRKFRRAFLTMSLDEDEEETARRVHEGKALTLKEWRRKASASKGVSFREAQKAFLKKLAEVE